MIRICSFAAAMLLPALGLLGQTPTYTGTVCSDGTNTTITVASDPPATAILVYPTPPGGGYFMTNDGAGNFSSTFGGIALGASLSFHLVVQVPQQFGPFPTHAVTVVQGCVAFNSTDPGGPGGGGPGGDPALGPRGFTHDVKPTTSGYELEFKHGAAAGSVPAVSNVIVRYRVNDGALQTSQMDAGTEAWTHEVPSLAVDDTIEYYFTETVGAEAVDTAWFTRTVGQAAPPEPTYPIFVEAAGRFRDRHYNEWRFDHYVAGYDVGRTFDFTITDHGTSIDIELIGQPQFQINGVDLKWYAVSGEQAFCNRSLSAISVRMDKNGNSHTWTIDNLVYGQAVDIEFTLLGGQTYYTEFFYYYIGSGKIGQKSQHPWAYAAGDSSISRVSVQRFGLNQHAANLAPADLREFMAGKVIFETDFDNGQLTNPPTSFDCNGAPNNFTPLQSPLFQPGLLGPLYSSSSCIACHMLDGRGQTPTAGTSSTEDMIIRLSALGAGGVPAPHPVYGSHIDTKAESGATPEATASVTWEEIAGQFNDGTPYSLRRPVLNLTNLSNGPLGNDTDVSLRIAPMISGVGLLDAVDDAEILAFADASDANGDGISGRPNMVPDVASGANALGRFGWKAGQPTLRQQAAAAFHDDMGMTSSLFPDASPPEVTDAALDEMTMYLRGLTLPPRDNFDDPGAILGKTLFEQANCTACHRPTMQTSATADLASYRNLTIQPFTDLLLHDMGPDLADGRDEFDATGTEWRTPPLWALGYAGQVLGQATSAAYPNGNPAAPNYLHDGRARSLMEAVLWHGGEADAAKQAVLAMNATDRDALIKYVEYPFADPPVVQEFDPADFNADGVVNSDDFFAFLTAFFASDADVNNDGVTNSDDFFQYLNLFFAA